VQDNPPFESFIRGYMLDHELVDQLLEMYAKAPSQFKNPGQLYGNHKAKKSTDLVLSPAKERYSPVVGKYISFVEQCMNDYINDFEILKVNNNLKLLETFNIQHYKKEEGFFNWHCEFMPGEHPVNDRVLVFMTYLQDIDNAGTEFLYQNITTKSVKGLTLLWPAYFTHAHKGQISAVNEKTIVTGWLSHDRNDTANK